MSDQNMDKGAEFNGLCAFALSTGKDGVEGGKNSSTIGGKVYLFSNPVAKFLFRILPNRLKMAEDSFEKFNSES